MENLFYQPDISAGSLFLDAEESRHCYKVLRKKTGDTVMVTDGKGSRYLCKLSETKPDRCSFTIETKSTEAPRNYRIHVAIAPTKNPDRTEWFVEKAVEIGCDEISFILCDKSERAAMKTERIQKLAISAMKQSLQSTLVKINPMQLLKDFILTTHATQRFIAYVDHTNPNHLSDCTAASEQYIVMIGPEGDFSKKEVELALSHNFQKVNLGPHRLRTETAGIVACHTLNLINRKNQ